MSLRQWISGIVICLVMGFSPAINADHFPEPVVDKESKALELQIQTLRAKLQDIKAVRVLVKLKKETREESPPPSVPQPPGSLSKAQESFVQQVAGQGVTALEPLQGTSLVLMTLTEEGLERVIATQQVQTIHEDSPLQPFGIR